MLVRRQVRKTLCEKNVKFERRQARKTTGDNSFQNTCSHVPREISVLIFQERQCICIYIMRNLTTYVSDNPMCSKSYTFDLRLREPIIKLLRYVA